MRYQLEKSSGRFSVVSSSGATVATLDKAFWTERAAVTIEGRPWEFGKESGGLRTAVDSGDPSVKFTAARATFWRAGWAATCAGTAYALNPRGAFSSRYEITRDGVIVGESRQGSFWANKPYVELPDDVPVSHAVFVLWIAYLMRARAAAAAANNGGA